MLGSQVVKQFSDNKKFKIYTTVRTKKQYINFKKNLPNKVHVIKFDLNKDNIKNLLKKIKNLNFIINCIGVIKPHIQENNPHSVLNAINVNSIFPYKISEATEKNKKIKIFQIATDCVYSGNSQLPYFEDCKHDASDVYGKTKSLGEVNKKNFYNIRASIIGREMYKKRSLFEWFVNLNKNSSINGFVNHYWNGITTMSFALCIKAIIEKNIKIPNNLHLLPANKLNKYQLLFFFKKHIKRSDIKIKKFKAPLAISRVLGTKYLNINSRIWRLTKYKKRPHIEDLILDL